MQDGLIISVIGLIFAVLGAGMLLGLSMDLQKSRRSLQWPQVQGKVRSAKVFQHKGEGGGSSAEIKYAYEVDGVGYESDRVHFGDVAASDMVLKYRIGHDVSVYYDPDDPSIAVLDRKMTVLGNITAVIIGVAFTGMGCLVIFVGIYQFFR